MEYEEYLEQGEILAGEGLIEEALSRFEQALAAAPENPEVIEAVGRALLNLDRLEEAEASFLDALEPDPEYPDAYVELGRYYGSMGDPALAKATFERWTARHPEDAEMLINAGLTAFDATDYAQALDFFEKATEVALVEEQKSGARTFRANALDMLGRYDEAVAAYEEVIAEAPDWWEAHANLGIGLDPENPEAHLELGILHEGRGEVREAEEHFVESLKSDPANPRALYSYASLYYAADDLDTAEELLMRAVAADARYSPALSALPSVRARRGDFRDALDYIEKAVEAGESDVDHFKGALEFAPLRADPRFRSLLSRMVRARGEG